MFDELSKYTDTTIYFVMAASATLIFVIRLVMAMFGADGDGDSVGDDGHHGHDSTGAFQLFSLLSILAFFMGTGWMGLAARLDWGWSGPMSLLAASAFGLLAMLLASGLAYSMRRLNKETKWDINKSVGAIVTVYLNIPAKGTGQGQVQINNRIVQAVSTGPQILAFAKAKVVAIEGGNTLIVEPQT